MKKNIVIGALILWNLILMAALLYVLANWQRPVSTQRAGGSKPAAEAGAEPVTEEFTLKAGDRLNSDAAPQIANRGLAIAATVDTQGKEGVIIAQGGNAHGYTLYVQDGELFFAARRNQTLTTVAGGKLAAGRHAIRAQWSKSGDLVLAVDGGAPATARAAGAITVTPTDGLDVGSDRYAPVGPYTVPNSFGGTIEVVKLKLLP